jgi:translocation and assembly module TamA
MAAGPYPSGPALTTEQRPGAERPSAAQRGAHTKPASGRRSVLAGHRPGAYLHAGGRPSARAHLAPIASLALGLWACAGARPPPGQAELRKLRFTGNKALSDGQLADKIATTANSWNPLADKRYLDPAVLQTDLRRLERLYQAHGYFDAKVLGLDIEHVDENAVEVEIHLQEGPATHVARVDVGGEEGLPDDVRKRLARVLKPLQVGEVFDEEAYEQAKELLGKVLRDHGYAEAEVEGEVQVDPAARTAAVALTVHPGERYTFGKVQVFGAKNVPRESIVRQAEGAVPPGKVYSERKLQDAQDRVFDMGVFSLAKVTRGAPDPTTHTLPTAVSVNEAPFRTLRFGFGLGFERYRDEARVGGEYLNRNFFGGLRRLDFDNRLSYIVTPDVFALFRGEAATGVGGYSKLTLTQPDLFWTVDLSVTAQLERDIEVGFTDNAALVGVALEKRVGRVFDALVGYNFQVVQLSSILDPAQLAGSSAPQLATSCTEPTCFLVLQYLEQRFQLDLRDSLLRPRKGAFLQLDLQEGGGPGASFTYLRVQPLARGFIPLADRLTLGLQLQFGWMRSFGEENGAPAPTPLTQRFFGGGPDGVRAYGLRLMSPVAVVCRDNNPNAAERHCTTPSDFEAVPVGGNGLYAASVALRIDVTRELSLVAFTDAGIVPIAPFELRAQDVAIAPGLGLRYFSPFGPVRLDFSYRLPNTAPDDGQLRLAPSQVVINYPPLPTQVFVNPGNTPRFNFQFSIGEAF